MSSALARLVLAAALLVAALSCGRAALAGAIAAEDMLDGQLVSSAAPAMLGPISSSGRTGWACKPERAAAAAGWRDAELPPYPASH